MVFLEEVERITVGEGIVQRKHLVKTNFPVLLKFSSCMMFYTLTHSFQPNLLFIGETSSPTTSCHAQSSTETTATTGARQTLMSDMFPSVPCPYQGWHYYFPLEGLSSCCLT